MKPFTFLFICIFPISTQLDFFTRMILWNTGQGQMFTYLTQDRCLHIDAGGDRPAPIKSLKRYCDGKRNEIFLTHYDWDHIGYVKKLRETFANTCLAEALPPGLLQQKQKFLAALAVCVHTSPELITFYSPDVFKDNNSRAYVLKRQFLITGDSPEALESALLKNIPQFPIRYYVLGHHGSRTSSGNKLLVSLVQLKQTAVSARKKRYGHPHVETLRRLQNHSLPLIKTEEFGNIHWIVRP